MNGTHARAVLEALVGAGVKTFCVCPGARNAPLLMQLAAEKQLEILSFFEERSAAFFALGRARRDGRPVCVITTSGTAAGELLPAMMEAHYTGDPLIALTADRPRRFRGSGAPQAAEQVGIFGVYAEACHDVSDGEPLALAAWTRRAPLHVNVCFEEPSSVPEAPFPQLIPGSFPAASGACESRAGSRAIADFIETVSHPLVLVGGLREEEREPARQFLLALGAPVYAEAVSGLREDDALRELRVSTVQRVRERARRSGYPIDGVLRIGGVPTLRFFRDLDESAKDLPLLSVSSLPFSGSARGRLVTANLRAALSVRCIPRTHVPSESQTWREADRASAQALETLLLAEPYSEPGMLRALSEIIPSNARVFVGNSSPIREWDLAASGRSRQLSVSASRGLNGIDGQISTFLGECSQDRPSVAVLGDLTALYDVAGFWPVRQLGAIDATIVVINNSGGRIFERMFHAPELINAHPFGFAAIAHLWGLPYEKWDRVPAHWLGQGVRIIELCPDAAASERFWNECEKR